MHRPSLVHHADLEQLVRAQQRYKSHAPQGKRPEDIEDALVQEYAPLLLATMPLFMDYPLRVRLQQLKKNIVSIDYFREELIKQVKEKFNYGELKNDREDFHAVFDYVENQAQRAETVESLQSIVHEVHRDYIRRTKEVEKCLAGLEKGSDPEKFFDNICAHLSVIYKANNFYKPEYSRPCDNITQRVDDWKNSYFEKIACLDGRTKPNREDVGELAQFIKAMIDQESHEFKLRCEAVSSSFSAIIAAANQLSSVKESVLTLIDAWGGEYVDTIKSEVGGIITPVDCKPSSYIDVVRTRVRKVIERGCENKAAADCSKLIKGSKSDDTLENKLIKKGIQSKEILKFLGKYLSTDYILQADRFHEGQSAQFFSEDKKSEHRTIAITPDEENNNAVFISIRVLIRAVTMGSSPYVSDIAGRETLLRVEDKGPENNRLKSDQITVSVVKSEMDIYDEDLRKDYILKRIKEDNGILFKLTHGQMLSSNDKLVIDQLLRFSEWPDDWRQQLCRINDSDSSDTLFLRVWRDELLFRNLFNVKPYQERSNGASADRGEILAIKASHYKTLQRFCEMPDLQPRLESLRARYEINQQNLNPMYATVEQLTEYLTLVHEKQWSKIAGLLNKSKTRDLMMCALHSLKEVSQIKEAVSYPRILYALDADTLTYFGLKDKTVALKIIGQSFWQRLLFELRTLFWGEKNLQFPAYRLQGEHLAQLAKKFPSLWKSALRKISPFISSLMGYRDLTARFNTEDIIILSEDPSAEVRSAAAKAILSDRRLADKVLNPADTVRMANAKVNLIRDSGTPLMYEDQSVSQAKRFYETGFDVHQLGEAVGHSVADDQTVAALYHSQFLRLVYTDEGNKRQNGPAKLGDKIIRLWSGRMRLPQREGIELIVKNALKQVLREANHCVIVRGAPEAYYQDVFADPVILKSVVDDWDLIKRFATSSTETTRKSFFNNVLRFYRATQEGFGNEADFSVKELDAVCGLYNYFEGGRQSSPDKGKRFIDLLLHHHNSLSRVPDLIGSNENNNKVEVLKLLENASSLQLIGFLFRNEEVQCWSLEKRNDIELRIQKLQAEKGKLSRRLRAPFPTKRKNAAVAKNEELEGEIRELQDSSVVANRVAVFYQVATGLIKNNKTLLGRIAGEQIQPLLYNDTTLLNNFERHGLFSESLEKVVLDVQYYLNSYQTMSVSVDNAVISEMKGRVIQQQHQLKTPFCNAEVSEAVCREIDVAVNCVTVQKSSSEILESLSVVIRHFSAQENLLALNHTLDRVLLNADILARILDQSAFESSAVAAFLRELNVCIDRFAKAAVPMEDSGENEDVKKLKNNIMSLRTFFCNGVLIAACTKSVLRQKIWSHQALQSYLSNAVDLRYVLLFFRASRCPDETLNWWRASFSRLLESEHNGLLEQHWHYLIEKINGFAAAVSYRWSREGGNLDAQKINELSQYNIPGYDFLRLVESNDAIRKSFSSQYFMSQPTLLPRLLSCHRSKQNHHHMAALMVKTGRLFILNATSKAHSEVVRQLLSDEALSYLVNYANIDNLQILLKALKAKQTYCAPLIEKMTFALHKGYLARPHVSVKFNDNPKFLKVLLNNSTNTQLAELVEHSPACLAIVVHDEVLQKRYCDLSDVGSKERVYLYLSAPKSLNESDRSYQQRLEASKLLQPYIISSLGRGYAPELLVSVLISLIRQDSRNQDYLEQVRPYLMAATNLLALFMQVDDAQVVQSLFFDPDDELMTKLWLTLSAGDLMAMMTHEVKQSMPQPSPFSAWEKSSAALPSSVVFDQRIISTLLKHLPAKALSARFLLLAESTEFLSAILSRANLLQMAELVSVNDEISSVVTAYFQANRHEFQRAMVRADHQSEKSQLVQCVELLEKSEGLALLIIDAVKSDYRNNSTEIFDAVIIDAISKPEDHDTVYRVLDRCYQLAGGDFYLNFSVPLSSSKTRLFLFYQFCGGHAITELYNSFPESLKAVWKAVTKGDPDQIDYWRQLQKNTVAGSQFTFSQLISDEYRQSTVSAKRQGASAQKKPASRSEWILYTLYVFMRHIERGYADFMASNLPSAIEVSASDKLKILFSSAINSKSRLLRQIEAFSSPLQLAQLSDADVLLLHPYYPIREWLFNSDGSRLLDKIQSQPAAFTILMQSTAFREIFSSEMSPNEINLVDRVSAFIEKYLTAPATVSRTDQLQDRPCFRESGQHGMSSVDEYKAILAAKEYYEFSRPVHDSGVRFQPATAELLPSMIVYQKGQFKIQGITGNPISGSVIPSKYLSVYFYAQFMTQREKFLELINNDVVYRKAFCDCFKIVPAGAAPIQHSSEDFFSSVEADSPQKMSFQVKFALSGLAPESDLLVMYCYARYLSLQAKMPIESLDKQMAALAFIAKDHIKRIGAKLYFNTPRYNRETKKWYENPIPSCCHAFLVPVINSLPARRIQSSDLPPGTAQQLGVGISRATRSSSVESAEEAVLKLQELTSPGGSPRL